MERHDVVVIGGGQAGLAAGHHLARRGLDFVVLERDGAIGDVWRRRWDSLRLFTPARYSGLPGLAFPGDPDRLPAKDEVAGYLAEYAAGFDLPVRLGEQVKRLAAETGGYVIETEGGGYWARNVVVATGPFQHPAVPEFADNLDLAVFQIHSSAYRNPAQIPPGDVLVVGSLASGCQIAEELALTRRVCLSTGRMGMPAAVPHRILGRHPFWWVDKLRIMDLSLDSRLGRFIASKPDSIIGAGPRRLRRWRGVGVLQRAITASGDTVTCADGRKLTVSNVVWATGYRSDYRWIDLPVLDDRGLPVHRRGVTDATGLYFLGLSWQWTRGSALIGWVGADAEFVVDDIASRRQARDAGLA